MIKKFRTWLARLIDPEYVKVENFADCMIRVSKEMEAELISEQEKHRRQLFELGKYKANYRLVDAALRNRNSIFLRVTRSSGDVTRENWFPGHCTAEKLFASLTGGEQLPHKELA